TVGSIIVPFIAIYGVMRFEANRKRVEETFQELGSESGVWAAKRMWLAGFYLACILVIASFGFSDLVNIKSR
ncbi:MAG TPA: hypothetical protein VN715_10715, partial [Roseiarcus sp.]|nr:hypothetical protein [Roseiarcus sp.]